MAAPARPIETVGSSDRRRWHNHLPAWILADERYKNLSQGPANTLQAIADSCDPPGRDGSLLVAFQGSTLFRKAKVSRRTFIRHLQRLEARGFVVFLGRTHCGSNQWAIPGSPGALDPRRRPRERRQRMVRDDGSSTFVTITPGSQMTFVFPAPRGHPLPPKVCHSDTPPVSICHTPCVNLSHPLCHSVTQPSSNPSSNGKSHGDGDGVLQPQKRRLPNITIDDLTDIHRLLELHKEAINRGLSQAGESGRILFVAMAEHALNAASNPCAMFARNVNRGFWRSITQADEDRAVSRLQVVQGDGHKIRPADSPSRAALSKDAQFARAAIDWAERVHFRGNLFSEVNRKRPEWTRERWDQAIKELRYHHGKS